MKIKFCNTAFLAVIISAAPLYSAAQQSPVKQVQLSRFELQSSVLIQDSGKKLSVNNYIRSGKWYPVIVPSTVLYGLVKNNVYPDPYQGLNNMLIPDASDVFNKKYDLDRYSYLPGKVNPWAKPYWYRTHFNIPATDRDKNFQLIFKGINYRAEVWLNGRLIADSTQMAGMFAEYALCVSRAIKPGSTNTLAIKIFPLDYPGLPATEQLKALGPFYENGGPTGDIGKNVTMLCSTGWDWMPPVRDRNMGIWQPVYLRTTGAVTIGKPKIVTDLPRLPDTSSAAIKIDLSLSNYGAAVVNGKLKVSIAPENFIGQAVIFERPFIVPAGNSKLIHLDQNTVSQLLIKKPELWWPNGYGKPNLYRMRLQYSTGKQVMDDTSFVFGIRTVATRTSDVGGFTRREFLVNGKRVHLNGGAWVPDMLVHRDSARYDHELSLCRNANVNLVRIWGGGITPPDAFWNAADKFGLMVWSDFWITGDTQGEFKGSPDWPLQADVFTRNVISTIYRIRNHPSLLVWTGGNEGHARKPLYDVMRNNIIQLDGTRPFIPSSSGFAKLPEGWDGSWPDNKPSGVYSGGPYAWKDPKEYYKLADAGKDWVFKDETGLPSQPPYNTLAKNIPDTTWDKTLPYPLNNSWGYHDAATGAGKYDEYYNDMVARYGKPVSREDFSNKMQLMNATGYQAVFEAAGQKLTQTGGVMLWKLNAAFPSVIWQIYDWYLQPNAGYYAMQNACEPIHIQFNQNDSTVAVINRRHLATGPLSLFSDIFDTKSNLINHQIAIVNLDDEGVKKAIQLSNVLKPVKSLCFVVLTLKDLKGTVVSRNTYWMAPNNDYTALSMLPKTSLKTEVTKLTKYHYTIKITNLSEQLAFFVRPQLMLKNEEVMPSYWTAGYVSLPPHESTTLTVSAPASVLGNSKPVIKISGWNANSEIINLPSTTTR